MATKATPSISKTKTAVTKKAAVKKEVVKKVATKKVGSVKEASSLDPRIFSYKANETLIAQVLHVYRDNLHQDTSKVKTRGELTRTTRKMFKQKGTGNARHGSRMSPTFVGGGIAFGPTGIKPANLKVNKKMKAAALAGLLSLYHKDNSLELVTLPKVDKPQLSAVKSIFPKDKTLFVYGTETDSVLTSLRNLKNVSLISASKLNANNVAGSKYISLTATAHENLVNRLTPLLKVAKK